MTAEIVTGSFPRDQIVGFGGLPVLDALPSRGSRHLREAAAAALERMGAPVPPGLPPDERGDAERLAAALADPGSVAWWLPLVSWNGGAFRHTGDHLRWLAERTRTGAVGALVIGGTFDHGRVEADAAEPAGTPRPPVRVTPIGGDPYAGDDEVVLARAVRALAERAADFPNLRALFAGEIDDDQVFHGAEVDAAALLEAFPALEELVMCAHLALRFRATGHRALRRLAFHGMLEPDEIRGIAASRLPALEALELWSAEDFGDEQDPDERSALDELFGGGTLPRLRHLGLRGFTFIDRMVEQLAGSRMLPRLSSLDLSRGPLTDAGAAVLLESAAFRGLERLELGHHRMSADMAGRVARTLGDAGVEVGTGA
ncbi:hypothetical protein [Spirillospora sp. NPDC029432]|uniref:hypothetical protein n=1 Tax=Spirillospora sp. NPDC029432 TaxID=3154599 RepID=UPI003452FFCC